MLQSSASIESTPAGPSRPASKDRHSASTFVSGWDSLAIPAPAQANQEKALISVEPWILPWHLTCVSPTGERRSKAKAPLNFSVFLIATGGLWLSHNWRDAGVLQQIVTER